jgi:threonine dehydrogenase-like Zn-dependent dehydrogenase
VGSEVKLFKPGDRVVVGAITPDWGDIASQAGHSSQSLQPLGGWKFSNTKDGVFAEYFHVNEADANMARIPDTVPDEMAVYCADMLSTGVMVAKNADIPLGGSVCIFAQGPVGLMATVGARLRGAGLIVAVESSPARQELARFYGADVIVDHTSGDVVQQVRALTDGQGVDSAIEALGRSHVPERNFRDQGRLNDLECGLSRTRRLRRYPTSGLGRWHGRQNDQNWSLSRWSVTHGAPAQAPREGSSRSDADDPPHVPIRPVGQGL